MIESKLIVLRRNQLIILSPFLHAFILHPSSFILQMDAPYTQALAGYIAGSTFDELPKPIVEHVKLLVLDTIGVGVFGASLPWSERLRATAQAMEAPGRVSVWCTPLGFSAPTAAMINATAVHAFELDDIGPGGHNGSVTLSSALGHGPAPRPAVGRRADQRHRGRNRNSRARQCVRGQGAARGPGISRSRDCTGRSRRSRARVARAGAQRRRTSCTRSGTPASRRRA